MIHKHSRLRRLKATFSALHNENIESSIQCTTWSLRRLKATFSALQILLMLWIFNPFVLQTSSGANDLYFYYIIPINHHHLYYFNVKLWGVVIELNHTSRPHVLKGCQSFVIYYWPLKFFKCFLLESVSHIIVEENMIVLIYTCSIEMF